MATQYTVFLMLPLFTLYCFSSLCVGGSRNVCLSDSKDTLSAASDREVNNEGGGEKGESEVRRRTRAATQRRQKEESSNAKMNELNPTPSSERRGRDASVKATQAQKLLAKVCMVNKCLFGGK